MRSIVFIKRNQNGVTSQKGEFSSFGILWQDDSATNVPLDPTKVLWIDQTPVFTEFDRKGQDALARLLQEDSNVGDFLLKLIEAAAKEKSQAAK